MKQMKIRITSADHSETVQKALFRLGYDWWPNKRDPAGPGFGPKTVQWINKPDNPFDPYLYTTSDGDIQRSASTGHFNESENEEYVYSLGLMVPGQQVIDNLVLVEAVQEVLLDADGFGSKAAPPPIGLRPRHISEELYTRSRFDEIGGAIHRYVNCQLDIPYAWVQEYMELEQKLLNLEKKA